MFFASRLFLVLAGVLFSTMSANAQGKKLLPTAIELVRKHIDGMPQGKDAGEVLAQSAVTVKAALPDQQIVIVRFRIYPVARVMPEGLSASNLFAVNKEGRITHLKDVKTLEKFFHAHAIPAKEAKDAKTVLSAWLTLTPEFHQDGFFKFEVLDKEFAVDGEKASGRAVVMQGGNGDLRADLVLDKDGKLAKATEKAAIRPGPRPICQATKLLDADPVVRRIAEQDLLIMGLSARDYIMEQRALASPELQQAIDRVCQQIEKNGW
jgi:hypothetical protein